MRCVRSACTKYKQLKGLSKAPFADLLVTVVARVVCPSAQQMQGDI